MGRKDPVPLHDGIDLGSLGTPGQSVRGLCWLHRPRGSTMRERRDGSFEDVDDLLAPMMVLRGGHARVEVDTDSIDVSIGCQRYPNGASGRERRA